MDELTGSDASRPSTWVLTGHKAGDNTQVLALAEALGWPFEVKQFRYRKFELISNRLLGVTLAGIDRLSSSDLQAPWPDLVITAGRRNEPVARWIRKQSGGRTRLVHVGRPWAPLSCFDLIVVTPQYFLPEQSNVLYIDLPLHRLTRVGLDGIRDQWLKRFNQVGRPYWAVLLGGDSGPFVFTSEKAVRLARWLNSVVAASGGSVLVTDSARTPTDTYHAFLSQLDVPVHAHYWHDGEEENPYMGYLALADRLVVTGESMSMLAEASAVGRPLFIYDLSDCPGTGRLMVKNGRPWWRYGHNFRFKPLSHRLAMRLGPRRMRRDISRIQDRLVGSGHAVWVGQEWRERSGTEALSDRAYVAERVRSLVDR